MIDKILDNRFIIIYALPFCLGVLTVFSFQPFNFSFINFILLPIFFYLVVYVRKKSQSIYRKKPYKKNLFLIGFTFGFGFYLSGIFWIAYSLTFDDSFKFLIPLILNKRLVSCNIVLCCCFALFMVDISKLFSPGADDIDDVAASA